jgi:hypothetical protein
MIQNETAENLRNKLENLRLHSGVSASEYINKFWHGFAIWIRLNVKD